MDEAAECGLSGDAPDSASAAAPVKPAIFECQGKVLGGDEDWYSVDVPEGASLHVMVNYDDRQPPYEHTKTCLVRPDESTYDCSIAGWWRFDVDVPGRWLVGIQWHFDDADYLLTLSTHQQKADVHILLGSSRDTHSLPGHGVNGFVGPSEHDGLDGAWIELAKTAEGGEYIDTDRTTLFYYDEDFEEIPPGRCGWWTFCEVPAGTHRVYVTDGQFDETWDLVYYHG